MDALARRDRALLTLERSKSTLDRAKAAETLRALAVEEESLAEELAGLLPRLLDDAQEEVRRAALEIAACVLEEDESFAVLARRVRDASATVRVEAVGQLADLARADARGVLAAALEDADFHVRFEAARGMANLHHHAGYDVLIEALDHPDVCFRALGALAELGDARAVPEIERLFRRWMLPAFEKTQAAGVLSKLGSRVGEKHLLDRTKKRSAADRPMAIELCGEVKIPGAFERLSEILADAKDLARGAAARGLGRLGDARAEPALRALLEEPKLSDDDRLDVAEGLWRLSGAKALSELERAKALLESPEAQSELDALLKMLA